MASKGCQFPEKLALAAGIPAETGETFGALKINEAEGVVDQAYLPLPREFPPMNSGKPPENKHGGETRIDPGREADSVRNGASVQRGVDGRANLVGKLVELAGRSLQLNKTGQYCGGNVV